MPRFSRLLRTLILKGADLLSASIPLPTEEESVNYPKEVDELFSCADQLLKMSEDLAFSSVTAPAALGPTSVAARPPLIVKTPEYCPACFIKHLGRGITYIGEAIDFYDRDKGITERVQHKVLVTMNELAGMDDDTSPDMPQEAWDIYNKADALRKEIESKGRDLGSGGRDDRLAAEGELRSLQERAVTLNKRLALERFEQKVVEVLPSREEREAILKDMRDYKAGRMTWDALMEELDRVGIKKRFLTYLEETKRIAEERKGK